MKINVKHSFSQALPPAPLPVVRLRPLTSAGDEGHATGSASPARVTPLPTVRPAPAATAFRPAPGSPPVLPAATSPPRAEPAPFPRLAPPPPHEPPRVETPPPSAEPSAAGERAGLGQVNVLNLLADLSTTLPIGQNTGLSRLCQARDIARQIRAPRPVSLYSQPRPSHPADISLGVVQALRRNMPAGSAPALTRFEQMARTMKTMNSLVSSLAPTVNALIRGQGPDVGNFSTGAGMPTMPAPPQGNASGGLGDTLERLLASMDDNKKRQLAQMAQRLVGELR